jgi:cytochrome c oxidase subunit I+III
MGLVILFIAIAFASLLISYFYLRLENPVWPPADTPLPALGTGTAGVALVVASAVAVAAARRRLHAEDQRGFVVGLVATLALAALGMVVQFSDVAALGLDASAHAYASMFHTLTGFLLLVQTIAMIMIGMTLFWAVRGLHTARRHAPVANVVRFFLSAVAIWVIGFATRYLGPYLT